MSKQQQRPVSRSDLEAYIASLDASMYTHAGAWTAADSPPSVLSPVGQNETLHGVFNEALHTVPLGITQLPAYVSPQQIFARPYSSINQSNLTFNNNTPGSYAARTPYPAALVNLDAPFQTSLFSPQVPQTPSQSQQPSQSGAHHPKRRRTESYYPGFANQQLQQSLSGNGKLMSWGQMPTQHFYQSTNPIVNHAPALQHSQQTYSGAPAMPQASSTISTSFNLPPSTSSHNTLQQTATMIIARGPSTDPTTTTTLPHTTSITPNGNVSICDATSLVEPAQIEQATPANADTSTILTWLNVIDRSAIVVDRPLPAAPVESLSDEEPPQYDSSTGRRICADTQCGKQLSERRVENYCIRCVNKKAKQRRGPTVIPFLEDMTVGEAYRNVYTLQKGNKMWPMTIDAKKDFDDNTTPEARKSWIKAIIDAMNKVYHMPAGRYDEDTKLVVENWISTQQGYNLKFHDQYVQYNARMINSRAHLLLEAAIRFQHGNVRTLYDDGGDNLGYTTNERLLLSQRLQLICDTLEEDKRVAMDVIEGRGVNAFVRDPEAFERRKIDNVKSNAKKRKMKDATHGSTEDAAVVVPYGSRKTQRMKTAKALEVERLNLAEADLDSIINVGPPRGRQKKVADQVRQLKARAVSSRAGTDYDMLDNHDEFETNMLGQLLRHNTNQHTTTGLAHSNTHAIHANAASHQGVNQPSILLQERKTRAQGTFDDEHQQTNTSSPGCMMTGRTAQYLQMDNTPSAPPKRPVISENVAHWFQDHLYDSPNGEPQ